MHGLRHPFGGALYEQDGEGNVRVTLADESATGLFTPTGRHLSGDLRECDPQLCGWVSGPLMVHHRMGEGTKDE